VVKDGNVRGSRIPACHLSTMLSSELFLQQFRALDSVVKVAHYLPDFRLVTPGYNDGGPCLRLLYLGPEAQVESEPQSINRFLDVMAFASSADRTNAVAAALTVQLRHLWAGAKPLIAVTSTKSHGGKDTIISFAAGNAAKRSVSYQRTDWAFQHAVVQELKHNPDTGLLNVENARLEHGSRHIASTFLERFLTDPEPSLSSPGTGGPVTFKNHLVVALSTNFGTVNEDLMNRALPIHLAPVGNVADRESPIGNPKLEYLPAHRDRIEAELRGMVERWKSLGRPPDNDARHPFSDWARTVGGILKANGYSDFLGNCSVRRTVDDPVRKALGLLGAARPDEWLRAHTWAQLAVDIGVARAVIPQHDRDTEKGRERGMGVVLSAHADETFDVSTDDYNLTLRLERARRRFDGGEPGTRYRFVAQAQARVPEDGGN
jgi:hypothetical protein